MNNLEKLKKAIIKEIPEGTEHEGVICYECKKKLKLNGYGLYAVTIIRLADVLRVIWIVQPTMEITDKDRVDFGAMVNVTEERVFEVVQDWNLSKNNLDLQSKGTIDFLTNLICKDE